jgi:hypothetical protein
VLVFHKYSGFGEHSRISGSSSQYSGLNCPWRGIVFLNF